MAQKKILVVDDSGTSRMFSVMALGRGTYQILTARDGAEAVEVATAEQPDLILMDVTMPEMDGFTACRTIRAQASTNAIPVILVTTRGEPVNVEMGFASGCNDYITKPVNSVELLSKVKHLLGA